MTSPALVESGVPATMPVLPELFRYDPPVSSQVMRGWQREIDRLFPVEDRISRLALRWEPGDVWQPIQRFVIWQCVDPNTTRTAPIMLEGVRGPTPRGAGHYCAKGWCLCGAVDARKWIDRWKGSLNGLTDKATWDLYHETGLVGTRWWTIQGARGGHRYSWDSDELESKLSVMMGGPQQTPAPGDLPYAPFDGRVAEKIAALDKVKHWKGAIDFCARNLDTLSQEQKEAAMQARAALWDWIDWGIQEEWENYGGYFKEYLRGMGRSTPGKEKSDLDYEQVQKYFIESVD